MIVYKETIWLEVVILLKYYVGRIEESLVMMPYKYHKSDCEFLLHIYIYIYIEREREREMYIDVYRCMHVYTVMCTY